MKRFYSEHSLIIKKILLFGILFTLPMYTILNNILLGMYIAMCILDGDFKSKLKIFQNNFKWAIPVLSFFLLAVIASTLNYSGYFFKNIEKYWSFLLLPVAFFVQNNFFIKYKRLVFQGLLWGCFLTLVVSYINVFYEMYTNSEPFSYLFRWRHLNHRFTDIADTHPAYIGLFVTTSTIYLFLESSFRNTFKILIFIFFSMAMFQLASRTAMGIYILSLTFILVLRYKKNGFLFLAILGLVGALFISNASDYLKKRMFSFENIENDTRFNRLMASYEVFIESPILGVGLSSVESLRNQKYLDYGFKIAYDKNYNAHNQFMEYLTINGILGGVVYLSVFVLLIYLSIKEKDYLFLMIFLFLFIANITESMLVRIKGIEYFAIFATLFLSRYTYNTESNINANTIEQMKAV